MKFIKYYIPIVLLVSSVASVAGFKDFLARVPYAKNLNFVQKNEKVQLYQDLGISKKEDVTPIIREAAALLAESGFKRDSAEYKFMMIPIIEAINLVNINKLAATFPEKCMPDNAPYEPALKKTILGGVIYQMLEYAKNSDKNTNLSDEERARSVEHTSLLILNKDLSDQDRANLVCATSLILNRINAFLKKPVQN